MVPPLSQKGANQSTNLCQGLFKKVGFSLIFEPILQADVFDKMLAHSVKKSTFVLVSDFLAVVISHFCSNIIRKGAF